MFNVNQFKDISVIGNKKIQYQQFLKYHKIKQIIYQKLYLFLKRSRNLEHLFNGKIYILKPENGLRNGITIVSIITIKVG